MVFIWRFIYILNILKTFWIKWFLFYLIFIYFFCQLLLQLIIIYILILYSLLILWHTFSFFISSLWSIFLKNKLIKLILGIKWLIILHFVIYWLIFTDAIILIYTLTVLRLKIMIIIYIIYTLILLLIILILQFTFFREFWSKSYATLFVYFTIFFYFIRFIIVWIIFFCSIW